MYLRLVHVAAQPEQQQLQQGQRPAKVIQLEARRRAREAGRPKRQPPRAAA
jgi:hypothetical protein